MAFTVRLRRNPTKAQRELARLSKELGGADQVQVGLPRDSNPYPDGTSVILIGAVHEFGSPVNGIPSRSYLRSTVTENREKYRDLLQSLAEKVVDGDITKRVALGRLGLQAQVDVQTKIEDIKAPPLARPRPRREGQGDEPDNPLVDTGHLVQSITFKVDD